MTEALMVIFLVVGIIGLISAAVTAIAIQPLRRRLTWLEIEARRVAHELTRLPHGAEATAPPVWASPPPASPPPFTDFLLPTAPPAPPPQVARVAPSPTMPVPPAAPPRPERPVAPPRPAVSPEERLGQWLGWLAAVTVVLTVAFFLKWTYDQGWLARVPVWAYVGLGWLGGATLLGAGERFRRTLPLYAQGLTGAGVSVLYLTTYAGYNYHVLAAGPASVGLVLVGGLALWQALRQESPAIGWIGVVLAYVSPLLIGDKHAGPVGLFVYLTALNGVVLAISVVRRWVPFRTAAFLATTLLYLGWRTGNDLGASANPAIGFVLVNWAIFVAVLAIYPLRRREPTHDSDLALAALNPLAAGAALYSLLQAAHPGWIGGASVLFALAYWLLSRAIRARRRSTPADDASLEAAEAARPDYLEQLFFAAAVIFAVLAVPLQAQGRLTTTVWALMGAGLYVSGARTRSGRTQAWAALPLVLAVCRLPLADVLQPAGASPLYQSHGLAFGSVLLSLLVVGVVAVQEWEATGREDQSRLHLLVLLTLLTGGLADWWLHLDLPSGWAPVGWSVVAVLAMGLGWRLRSPELRATGLLLSLPPVLLAAFEPTWTLAGTAAGAMLPGRLAALTLSLAVAWSYLGPSTAEEGEREVAGTAAAGAAAVLAMTWGWLGLAAGWLPLTWSLVAGLLLWAGLKLQRPSLRALGLLAAAAVTGEVLLRELDLALAHPLLLHSRSLASVAAIGVWVAAAWVYHRWGNAAERALLPVLVLGANLQALGWISLEAVDLGTRLAGAQWAHEAAQLGLSAAWMLYAAASIGVGFRRDSMAVRWGGVVLLLLAVAKAYLFDLSFLALGYRVLSFLILALVLLGVSFLYQQRGSGGSRREGEAE